MAMRNSITSLFIVCVIICTAGCDPPISTPTSDTQDNEDARHDVEPNQGCVPISFNSPTDLLCEDDTSKSFIEYGTSDFGKFKVPTDAISAPLPLPKTEIRNHFGDNVQDGLTYGFNKQHYVSAPRTGYVQYGQDVKIHVVTIHDRESYDTSFATLTTLINFGDVRAEYANYRSDRLDVKEEETGRTAEFPITEDIEQYDITIPAERFDEPGRYSIGVTLNGRGEPNTGGAALEFIAFYGGCEPSKLICANQSEVVEKNREEKTISELARFDTYLYPANTPSDWSPTDHVIASPGETLSFSFSTEVDNIRHTAAFVPTLNGEPTEQFYHVEIPKRPDDLKPGVQVVGARKEFELRAPQEKGKYELEFAQHVNPALTSDEATALGISTFSFSLGSNNQTIEVR